MAVVEKNGYEVYAWAEPTPDIYIRILLCHETISRRPIFTSAPELHKSVRETYVYFAGIMSVIETPLYVQYLDVKGGKEPRIQVSNLSLSILL